MALISDKVRKQIKDIFKSLSKDVEIIMFTQETECEHCKLTRELLEEISKFSKN